MIEINLVPDVKQELLRAQRQRNVVSSLAILLGIGTIALVIVLAVTWFGAERYGDYLDARIEEESKELLAVEDLNKTVTIQSQLSTIATLHSETRSNAQFVDVLAVVNPSEPNNIKVSESTMNPADKTITITGTASNGYQALEALKKTILNTKIQYSSDEGTQTVPLTNNVYDLAEKTFGEDNQGQRVLQFTVTFEYADELTRADLDNLKVISPEGERDVTDSRQRVPESLFSGGLRSGENGEEN
ncbi:hypothetical protein FJZ39_02075 [Candidatus Saccharibacteria bacterium]|nr:hypothetical protein [Candidatus Saccharibacteria bacterium]